MGVDQIQRAPAYLLRTEQFAASEPPRSLLVLALPIIIPILFNVILVLILVLIPIIGDGQGGHARKRRAARTRHQANGCHRHSPAESSPRRALGRPEQRIQRVSYNEQAQKACLEGDE